MLYSRQHYNVFLQVTPFFLYNVFLPKHAMFIEVDETGKILNSFHDPDGSTIATGVGEAYEHQGAIYTGHFSHPYVGYITTTELYGVES